VVELSVFWSQDSPKPGAASLLAAVSIVAPPELTHIHLLVTAHFNSIASCGHCSTQALQAMHFSGSWKTTTRSLKFGVQQPTGQTL
jgi:hypothetical protein